MKIKPPQPFTFEEGPRAVLLLHGFTGHSADVRMLGRFLQKHGYTSHAPIYRGHGREPEALLESNPDEWWEDTLEAYNHLRNLGYEEIAVAGLSLGGALGLKLASREKVKAIIPMCTPMFFDNKAQLTNAFTLFARQYKEFEQKDPHQIEGELLALMAKSDPMFQAVGNFIEEVNKLVDMIYAPTFVVQARKDQIINPESANYIYENVETEDKKIKWYEKSGHVITTDVERDELQEDILQFLQSLNWE
ncbi:MAG TPA: alpha/beta fold hydrolase [Pseudogracilibacillus sp.]|nr:alpha/beta fold hydrolase [Pseudogracilibacillus sp.]